VETNLPFRYTHTIYCVRAPPCSLRVPRQYSRIILPVHLAVLCVHSAPLSDTTTGTMISHDDVHKLLSASKPHLQTRARDPLPSWGQEEGWRVSTPNSVHSALCATRPVNTANNTEKHCLPEAMQYQQLPQGSRKVNKGHASTQSPPSNVVKVAV